MNATQETRTICFGAFEMDVEKRRLIREGENIHLAHRPFQVLLYLIENEHRVVTRTELLDKFWEGHDVYEAALSKCVGAIRKALDDRMERPQFIETRWADGYRFIGKIENETPAAETSHEEHGESAENNGVAANAEINDEIATPQIANRRAPLFLIVAGLAALLVFAAVGWILWQPKPPLQLDSLHSLAVIPLRNLTGNPEQDYLVDGMTESLIAAVSKMEGIKVISRGSVAGFKDTDVPPREIGEKLGVEALLEGSVRRNGDRLRVEMRIVNTQDGSILWSSDTYERPVENIVDLEDEMARAVAVKLRGGQAYARRRAENAAAHQFYAMGRYFWQKRTPEALLKAVEQFEKALAADPEFALAHAGLADCYVLLAEYRVMPAPEGYSKGRTAATKALELDADSAEARTALAYILAFYDWNFSAAEKEFREAISRNPNYVTAHQWYAEYLQAAGRLDEAARELHSAEELDPLSLIVKTDIAANYYYTRQYDAAIDQSRKVLDIDPNFGWGYSFYWLSYKEKGMLNQAAELHLKNDELFGETPENAAERKAALASGGWRGYWLKWIEQKKRSDKKQLVQSIDYAAVYLMIDDRERAMDFLKESFEKHEKWFLFVRSSPMFDSLQSDPRYEEMVRSIGLS